MSTCLLLTDSNEEGVLEKLRVVASVSDGFRLADEDLKQRGPGEYFGLKQSGFPDFRMADLRDIRLIESTRQAAAQLLHLDPEMARPEHRLLVERIEGLRQTSRS